jgi:hypothetical protein
VARLPYRSHAPTTWASQLLSAPYSVIPHSPLTTHQSPRPQPHESPEKSGPASLSRTSLISAPTPKPARRPRRALAPDRLFARSLLVYELPDGKLKLIEGHLRRDMEPDIEVEVEVLDVNDEEARALLLYIDPLAELALLQDQIHQRLMDLTPTDSLDLQSLCQQTQATIDSALEEKPAKTESPPLDPEEQFLRLVKCRDEKHQVELLQRFHQVGLECKALLL